MDTVPLEPRPGIMKCEGADLPECSRCTRHLAPVADEDQRWLRPRIADGACSYFADVQKAAFFYQPIPEDVIERLKQNYGGLLTNPSALDYLDGES